MRVLPETIGSVSAYGLKSRKYFISSPRVYGISREFEMLAPVTYVIIFVSQLSSPGILIASVIMAFCE